MNLRRPLCGILLLPLLLCLLATTCVAQAPIEPTQLPGRTSFYLLWRGSPAGDVRKSNALLSLWDDPDFAPVRAAMVDGLMNDSKKQKDKSGLTRDEISQFATLLDNPFTFGYLPRREDSAAKAAPPKTGTPAPIWNGLFFVYDRTGKEELLSKAVLRMRAGDAEIPKLTEVTVAGVKALKITRKSGNTYWAETGKYAVSASEESVFEEVLSRLTGNKAGGTLADLTAYKEAKPLLAGGLLEFYLHVPQLKDIAGDSTTAAPQVKALWNAIKLDSIRVLAGHISLEGSRTRLQGAILGDTAEGSLFDIWAAGENPPASLALLTPETVYYHESQISLPGIYNVLKRALAQSGSNSSSLVGTLESAAQTRIGMPLPDALALPSGEFGSLQTSPTMDPNKQIFFAGIRNKPESLKLIRTMLGDRLTSERNEGTTTYLKISLQGNQGSKGVAQWNFYHLALTPNLLLGATKSDTLRALASQPAGSGAGSLPKNLQVARAQFPEKLNGFSYLDMQRLDWPGLKQQWTAEVTKAAADSKNLDAAQKAKQWNNWLANVDPAVFPRHLHSVSGASWKDAAGVHFDEWID